MLCSTLSMVKTLAVLTGLYGYVHVADNSTAVAVTTVYQNHKVTIINDKDYFPCFKNTNLKVEKLADNVFKQHSRSLDQYFIIDENTKIQKQSNTKNPIQYVSKLEDKSKVQIVTPKPRNIVKIQPNPTVVTNTDNSIPKPKKALSRHIPNSLDKENKKEFLNKLHKLSKAIREAGEPIIPKPVKPVPVKRELLKREPVKTEPITHEEIKTVPVLSVSTKPSKRNIVLEKGDDTEFKTIKPIKVISRSSNFVNQEIKKDLDSENKPENKSENKPENKPENKSENKPENKPENKSEHEDHDEDDHYLKYVHKDLHNDVKEYAKKDLRTKHILKEHIKEWWNDEEEDDADDVKKMKHIFKTVRDNRK